MRQKENYSRHISVSLILTVAILVSFQFYIFREPGRIAADETRDQLIAVTEGRALYNENCAMCHGEQGEGVDGPPLNDKPFLANTADETIFSLIGSGVPGTEMPAWGQVHGGPFTDEQVRQLITFIRDWEAEAPDRQAIALAGDPVAGLVLYNSTCIVCHGQDGLGLEDNPAINDTERLSKLSDAWYRETIMEGRPAQGMPTWGTVLSPVQVSNLIALLRAWEQGQTVQMPGPEEALAEVMHMLEHGDIHGAEHPLEKAIAGATGELLATLNDAMTALESGDIGTAETAVRAAQAMIGGEMPADGHTEDGDGHTPDNAMPMDEGTGHADDGS